MTATIHTSTRPVSTLRRPWREAGSVSVELAILAPIFAGLIVLGIVVGRSSIAYNSVAAAAHDAARAASISRSETTAIDQATTAAQATLDDQGLDCATVTIGVEAAQLNRPVGEPAAVQVTVACELSFADLGLPMTRTLEAAFVSPVDVWRGRGGP